MKNWNKTQKWTVSILVVVSAIFLIVAIVFGVKFSQYKKDINAEPSKDLVALSIDVDGDYKPDYQFNITGKYKGESLTQFLKNDTLGDRLKANLSSSKWGTSLLGLSWQYKDQDNKIVNMSKNTDFTTNFISITSETYSNVSGPHNMTNVGIDDISLGKTNEFMFSYQLVSSMGN